MTKTDVIDRAKKKKVLVFAEEKDRQDALDRVVFLGNLGYDAAAEIYPYGVPDPDDPENTMSNLEVMKRVCEIREKDDCTVYVVGPTFVPYFEFMDVRRVVDFSEFIEECPMRVIYMGDVTHKEFRKYIEEEPEEDEEESETCPLWNAIWSNIEVKGVENADKS